MTRLLHPHPAEVVDTPQLTNPDEIVHPHPAAQVNNCSGKQVNPGNNDEE